MGFALWIDESQRLAWVQGTHEYRPLGRAVVALTGQFHRRDFRALRPLPEHLRSAFAGFFGSLETVNEYLKREQKPRLKQTPAHLL